MIISVVVSGAGCGDGGSKLTLLALQKSANMDGLEGLVVEVHQGDRSWKFDADDFRTTSGNGTRHTRAIPLEAGREFQLKRVADAHALLAGP